MAHTGDGITIGGIHQRYSRFSFLPQYPARRWAALVLLIQSVCTVTTEDKIQSFQNWLTLHVKLFGEIQSAISKHLCIQQSHLKCTVMCTPRTYCGVCSVAAASRGRPVAVINCRFLCWQSVIVNRQHAWPSEPGSTVAVIYIWRLTVKNMSRSLAVTTVITDIIIKIILCQLHEPHATCFE